MIIESMIEQMLHVLLLALTPAERWGAARHPFGASSATEGWEKELLIKVLTRKTLLSSVWLVSRLCPKEACLGKGLIRAR